MAVVQSVKMAWLARTDGVPGIVSRQDPVTAAVENSADGFAMGAGAATSSALLSIVCPVLGISSWKRLAGKESWTSSFLVTPVLSDKILFQ